MAWREGQPWSRADELRDMAEQREEQHRSIRQEERAAGDYYQDRYGGRRIHGTWYDDADLPDPSEYRDL